MKNYPEPLNLDKLKVYPLRSRDHKSRLKEILVEPADFPQRCDEKVREQIFDCAEKIKKARASKASIIVMYGAHLIKNGGQLLLNHLMDRGFVTHLATNGAGTIHDWEFSYLGCSTEDVRANVARGIFGAWDETGRYTMLALLAGGIRGDGYGRSLGRFIQEDGIYLPSLEDLIKQVEGNPFDELNAARMDLIYTMRKFNIKPGHHIVIHPYRNVSVLGHSYLKKIPLTIHPGIGYDIITNHPMYNGAVVGRAAYLDFRMICRAIDNLDNGVVICIGSAVMAPQVFEKAMSCVNNLRLQSSRPVVSGHTIYVVDIQDGGRWDWSAGEPPKDNPAYYLRFCKSFSRMGGAMHYVQCDNILFLHNLYHTLIKE
ncbi:MAG: hypothetical protein ACP5MG_03625 [Verrucomicrobiia bacterium]|jgi:hypothetical protein